MSAWRSRLPAIAAGMQPAVDDALVDGAELVAEAARRRAPFGAPVVHLRDEIHVEEPVRGAAETKVPVAAGGRKVFYAHMVEHGTVKTAPRPFLVPALAETGEAVVKKVWEAIREASRL